MIRQTSITIVGSLSGQGYHGGTRTVQVQCDNVHSILIEVFIAGNSGPVKKEKYLMII